MIQLFWFVKKKENRYWWRIQSADALPDSHFFLHRPLNIILFSYTLWEFGDKRGYQYGGINTQDRVTYNNKIKTSNHRSIDFWNVWQFSFLPNAHRMSLIVVYLILFNALLYLPFVLNENQHHLPTVIWLSVGRVINYHSEIDLGTKYIVYAER